MFDFTISTALACLPGLALCLLSIGLVLHEQRKQVGK